MSNKYRKEPDANRDPISGKPGGRPIGIAEAVNPTVEDAYWRTNYATRPYVIAGTTYDIYQPAYRYGWEARTRYEGKTWDEVEDDLGAAWPNARGTSDLDWDDARLATRDAWERATETP